MGLIIGRMRCFELFIQGKKLDSADWQDLVDEVKRYDKNFAVEIVFDNNFIEFYLYSRKDLSLLATKLSGFVLKPSDRKFNEKRTEFFKSIRFKLPNNKNIAEFKESEEIKNRRKILSVIISYEDYLLIKFYKITVYLKDYKNNTFFTSYYSLSNPFDNLELDFNKSVKIKKKSTPLFLLIDNEEAKLFVNQKDDGFLEVFGFPTFSSNVYFPLKNFEINKHTLIVGQTGVGKSKFIELFVKEISKRGLGEEYCVIIIDPHAGLYPQFLDLPSKMNFDFIRTSCDLFPAFSEPKISTELTILLFKTLLQDQFNAKMERVLKYAIYILFMKNMMSLFNLKRFLTELEFRKEVLSKVGEEDKYLIHFFETEFIELQTKFYEIAIMPVLVLIDELNFIPAFSKDVPSSLLEEVLNNNFLTCFSLNKIFLGEKATRLIAGLMIQQLFLIAQKRSLKKKIILIIDEVSLVENESMVTILSEARKFDLSLFLSQQYLTQISANLLKSVLSNIYNYFIFKVSDEDAKILVKNLQMDFPDNILKDGHEKGLNETDLKRNFLVGLNQRECVVRFFSQEKFYPAFKARTPDA